MTFKENILKKIETDRLKEKVAGSLGGYGSERRLDTEAMKELLNDADYSHKKIRDLDLYSQDPEDRKKNIIVLDNDLTLYSTTECDVVLRKSPTLKEMISIRNAMRILNDGDVVVTRKEETLAGVYDICIGKLDLIYDEVDMDSLVEEGMIALRIEDTDTVLEVLEIFREILGLVKAPSFLSRKGFHVLCGLKIGDNGKRIYGPHIVYDMGGGSLKYHDMPVSISEKGKIDIFRKMLDGSEEPVRRDREVFEYFKYSAMKKL